VDVKTALFKRRNAYYLVATNNGDEDKSASIHLPAIKKSGTMKIRNLITNQIDKVSADRRKPLSVDIHRKDGVVLEII